MSCFNAPEKTVYRQRKWKRSFTIIELLVVVSVIMILAGFLLPALNKARASAQTAICQGNMKQLGIAFAQYNDDNQGRVLGRRSWSGNYWGGSLIVGKYLNYKSLICPVSGPAFQNSALNKPNEKKEWRTGIVKDGTSALYYASYGINWSYFYDFNDSPARNQKLTTSSVRRPSHFASFADSRVFGEPDDYPYYYVRVKHDGSGGGRAIRGITTVSAMYSISTGMCAVCSERGSVGMP